MDALATDGQMAAALSWLDEAGAAAAQALAQVRDTLTILRHTNKGVGPRAGERHSDYTMTH